MRKKFLKSGVIAMMAVCGLSFVSCSEDNDEGMKSYKLTVSYSLPSDVEASNVEELKLILGSTTKNDTLSLDANPKEIELPQGQYKVPARWPMKPRLPSAAARLWTFMLILRLRSTYKKSCNRP